VKFRGQFATYAFVNAVFVVVSIFSKTDLMVVPVIWTVIMALRYSRLWTAGYDWRAVFKQTRDRSLIDLAQETVEEVGSVFDRDKREKLRARNREQSQQRALAPVGGALGIAAGSFGRFDSIVRQAAQDREDITRIVLSLPRTDQNLVEGVIPAADGLYKRIQSLAGSAMDQERSVTAGASSDLERQITKLESEANPLDTAGSEDRVRKLAILKRQRRALAEATKKRDEAVAKLESCRLQLQNMRLDILRLRAGGVAEVAGQITQLTMRARALADDVDAALIGVDEARLAANASARRGPRKT
jgi:serine/threonine-protein kinase